MASWEEIMKRKLSNFERMMLIEEQTANMYRQQIALELREIKEALRRPRR